MQPSNRIAKSIVSVLRHFKWNRVVVLAGENFMYIKNAFQVRKVLQHFIFNRGFLKLRVLNLLLNIIIFHECMLIFLYLLPKYISGIISYRRWL